MASSQVVAAHPMTLIRGDGIGPEISEAVMTILAAAGAQLKVTEIEAGLCSIEKRGVGISQESLDLIKKNKVALKGPTTTPVGGGHKSINVTIRKALDLYVNLRPCKTLPGLKTPFPAIDLIIVRENIEDTYGGIEHQLSEDYAQCLRLTTRSGSLRAHRYAFEMAKRSARKKVTCVHKANIMKITDGMWLKAFRDTAVNYKGFDIGDIIVDNCCMQLVSKPQQFDVLVLPNLFGDIVSDLCAGLIGGLGIASGANIGDDCAVFEAVHGSAPDIAGMGLANPTAMLMSSVHMLRHIGQSAVAQKVEEAVLNILGQQTARTKDLGGKASTKEFTMHVVKALG